ncbi:MAG: hypothetical protein EZS28_005603 [Streblomastix strix]|uniref:Uncharacterized protein n=1 Tax=Streblomastix strix TaxID=222440 RepID=A0A5J4WVM5_9EUKA|nr:MAG: hypothetical protein EZS28_005603 [Streblomastix strix]
MTKTEQLNKSRELDQKAFVILIPQNLSAYYAALTQARKRYLEKNEVSTDGLPNSLLLSKVIENTEPYIPSADNSYKILPNTIVRDKQTNEQFKQKAVDLLQEDQDCIHENSATLKVALFSFLIVVYRLPLDNVIAQFGPPSVASAATVNNQITTLYFDLRNGTDFIEQRISQLFEVDIKVNEANQSNIPDVTNENKRYEPYKPQVSVIGFNSKIDMNLLLKHLIKNRTKIQYMGSTIQAKQTIISHQDFVIDLRFIDILSFIPPNNTLKQFIEKFRTKDIKLAKGIFPHGSFNYYNYKQVLGQTVSFTKEDFYDKLNNRNISNEDYEQYINDQINQHVDGSIQSIIILETSPV